MSPDLILGVTAVMAASAVLQKAVWLRFIADAHARNGGVARSIEMFSLR